MISGRLVKVLLLLSIIFVFVPFSTEAKVLPKVLFEKALKESNEGDFIRAEKDWSSYLNENPDDAAALSNSCLLYTSPSPRDQRGSRMPSSA